MAAGLGVGGDRGAADALVPRCARPGSAVVAIGDAGWRARATAEVLAALPPGVDVVDLGPPSRRAPWAGVRALLRALDVDHGDLTPAVAAALDAVVAGRCVGDHLGVAADLGAALGSRASTRTLVVVRDAHRWDLGSAAALGSAAGRLAGTSLSLLVTQAPSVDGVTGLEAVVQPGGPGACEPVVAAADLAAARAAASLPDIAGALEEAGSWDEAARAWLDAGRVDRARRALGAAVESPLAVDVAARLDLRTESTRRGLSAVVGATGVLGGADPVAAIRLRVLVLLSALHRDDVALARVLLDQAEAHGRELPRSVAASAARELLLAGSTMVDVAGGADPGLLVRAAGRPLARLAEGPVDPDVVHVLSGAVMVLGWRGEVGRARELCDQVLAALESRRALVPLSLPLAVSGWLARRQAHFDRALADGLRAIELARAVGAVNDARFALVEVAHVEAMHGDLDACRAHVAELVPRGAPPQGPVQVGAASALAVAELLAGDPARAVEVLESIQAGSGSSLGPRQVAWRHNLVEAYVRTGRHDDARRVLVELERWVLAEEPPAARSLGCLERARGLVAPAGAYDPHFAAAAEHLSAYPGLRWRTQAQHARRLLADGRRAEAEPLVLQLLDGAAEAGVAAGADSLRRLAAHHGIGTRPHPPSARVARLVAPAVGRDDEEPVAVVTLLGSLSVRRGDDVRTPPAGRPSVLLGYVALHGVVHLEQALDVLWADATVDDARVRLRNVLARLRRTVGDVVVRDGEQLRVADGVVVDVDRFRAAARVARDPDPATRTERVAAALALWTGPPLPAWPYEDWASPAVEELRATYLELVATQSAPADPPSLPGRPTGRR